MTEKKETHQQKNKKSEKEKLEKIKKSVKKKRTATKPAKIILYGFLGAILLGAFILMLPVSSAKGEVTPFIDALFTATTSVCVTGLVTVATYSHWSLFGKGVIFILIQLGGLGIVSVATFIAIITGRKITLKERVIIQDTYDVDSVHGLIIMITKIVKGTFFVEGIGAVLCAIRFVPQFGLVKGVLYGIFHSVSAFCNAGIDVLGPDSLCNYVNDWYLNIVTMILIVTGGIGFLVWWDVIGNIKKSRKIGIGPIATFKRLTVHSKLAIVTTLFLIIGGAAFIFCVEYTNPDTIGNMNVANKALASMFESVTTRTAGFATIDQTYFRNASLIVICLLMFIGGSPMGTAGGVKTTTVAMLFLAVRGVLRGRKDTEVFKRKISSNNIKNGLSVMTISMTVLFVGTIILSITENGAFKDVVFEAVSAIGTAGLSRDFTSALSVIGKFVIVCLMFAGRIGPITMAMAFTGRSMATEDNREYPEKKILVG